MLKVDVIIVGGGHAGIEATYIAAKCGLSVMMITINADMIGQMSCNPAIGGIAKGNIVREIDALGGIMAKITDKAGIQFKMLNKSKGVAVWGNRAQTDKQLYRFFCRKYLEEIPNIILFQDMVTKIIEKNGKIFGVETESGCTIQATAVVLANGTFLNGLAHIGMNSFACGRAGERASIGLSESIQSFGIKAGRLKTGTPARIDEKTVDFSFLVKQKGDDDPWPFSYTTTHQIFNKAFCWELKTNEKTHRIIRENRDKSPLYSGKIKGIGPRYCPSIEDKVFRFGDRNGHTLFLEPEGLQTNEMYLNGFSTSLPFNVQVEMIHSLPGLEKASVIRPAYAIEYDFFYPVQLYPTLESKIVRNLYFAGQINGTSGYEEAACQGLIAGLNAAKKVKGEEEIILGRDTSYIGVLLDDLVTRGTEEPYRMFTSRAEYRLLLRQDNADERLMPLAYKNGLVDKETFCTRRKVWEKREKVKKELMEFHISPQLWGNFNTITKLNHKVSAFELIKRPQVSIQDIYAVSGMEDLKDRDIAVTVEANIKYSGFIEKQKKEIERQKKIEDTVIPFDIDYEFIEGLLKESREKLIKIRPCTLGVASRISGVTPADISVLIMHILKRNKCTVSHETMDKGI